MTVGVVAMAHNRVLVLATGPGICTSVMVGCVPVGVVLVGYWGWLRRRPWRRPWPTVVLGVMSPPSAICSPNGFKCFESFD